MRKFNTLHVLAVGLRHGWRLWWEPGDERLVGEDLELLRQELLSRFQAADSFHVRRARDAERETGRPHGIAPYVPPRLPAWSGQSLSGRTTWRVEADGCLTVDIHRHHRAFVLSINIDPQTKETTVQGYDPLHCRERHFCEARWFARLYGADLTREDLDNYLDYRENGPGVYTAPSPDDVWGTEDS